MQLSYEKLDAVAGRRKRGTEPTKCKVALTENIRANTTYMKDKWGCKNNAIKSMTLCNAPNNMKITFYDDGDLGEDDDYTLVEVKKDMNGCESISTFEETKIMDNIDVSYKKDDGLDGNISSFKVEFGKFNIMFIITICNLFKLISHLMEN